MVPRHDIILNRAHSYVVRQLLINSTNATVSRNVNEAALFIKCVKFSCSLTLPVLQYIYIYYLQFVAPTWLTSVSEMFFRFISL